MKTFGIIISAFILSAPFAVVYPIVPFFLLGLLYCLYKFGLNRFLISTPRQLNRGFFVAGVLLFPIAVAVPVLDGGILALGPYYGSSYNGDVQTLVQGNSVPYKSGQLVSYASDETHAPILAYVENGEVRWASELKPNKDFPLEMTAIVDMQVSHGILRDRVDFFATGSSEPGWAFLWKTGGVQKFYLKVF